MCFNVKSLTYYFLIKTKILAIHHQCTFHRRGISRTLIYSKPKTYSEPRYIENSGIFKTQGLFRHRRCQTFMMKRLMKAVNEKQFRNISLPRSLLDEINIMRQLLQRQLLYEQKTMAREDAEVCKILIYLLIYSNILVYLQLITVLVYGNSSPKRHEQDYLNFKQKL